MKKKKEKKRARFDVLAACEMKVKECDCLFLRMVRNALEQSKTRFFFLIFFLRLLELINASIYFVIYEIVEYVVLVELIRKLIPT